MAVKIDKGRNRAFDMTPMIDCVFQLLIFFLVGARFAEEERELNLMLPEATAAQPLVGQPAQMAVEIDEQGHYSLDGKQLTLAELRRALRQASANNPLRQAVVLRADRRCVWEYVVGALNACQEAKIRDYRVTTQGGG